MRAVTCKSILTKSKLPKVEYCCNPYIGCTHGCTYCYASFMKRFTGHTNDEWGKFIDYKENAVEILADDVHKIKENDSILLGSVTDAYQPIEKKFCLSRDCLKIFSSIKANISILTKSDLILRDIDILQNIEKCEVGISCGIENQDACYILEPHASSIQSRITALKQLHKNHITTYAFIAPIIPFVTNLDLIFDKVKDYVDYVMGEFLNLNGCNRYNFQNTLSQIIGVNKTIEVFEMCKNQDLIRKYKEKYELLCKIHNLTNKGFFYHVQDKDT